MVRNSREFKRKLDSKNSEELIDIWVENDREKHPPETFTAIRLILDERGERLPLQNTRNYKSILKPTPAPRVKKLKKLTGIRGWFHSLWSKDGVVKFL
jgi:hypothetical protein